MLARFQISESERNIAVNLILSRHVEKQTAILSRSVWKIG